MHRFEPVTHVWEGALYNNAHRVVQIGTTHLRIDAYDLDIVVTGFFGNQIFFGGYSVFAHNLFQR